MAWFSIQKNISNESSIQSQKSHKPIPLFNPDIKSASWNLTHAITTAPPTTLRGIWVHFSIHFKSISIFQKNPPFQRQVSTSILTPSLSHSISEIHLHHTKGIRSQPLKCIPKFEKLSKDMWPKYLAVIFQD